MPILNAIDIAKHDERLLGHYSTKLYTVSANGK